MNLRCIIVKLAKKISHLIKAPVKNIFMYVNCSRNFAHSIDFRCFHRIRCRCRHCCHLLLLLLLLNSVTPRPDHIHLHILSVFSIKFLYFFFLYLYLPWPNFLLHIFALFRSLFRNVFVFVCCQVRKKVFDILNSI